MLIHMSHSHRLRNSSSKSIKEVWAFQQPGDISATSGCGINTLLQNWWGEKRGRVKGLLPAQFKTADLCLAQGGRAHQLTRRRGTGIRSARGLHEDLTIWVSSIVCNMYYPQDLDPYTINIKLRVKDISPKFRGAQPRMQQTTPE